MKNKMKIIGIIGLSALAGDQACGALEQLIYNANESAENVSKGNLYSGLCSAAVSCLFAGLSIYAAYKKDDEIVS